MHLSNRTTTRGLCLLASVALVACGLDASTAAQTASAWRVLDQAFDAHFFDAELRRRHFADDAADALVLPGLVDRSTYKYLQVADLRRVSPERRDGQVAIAVDGWPMSLRVGLTRGDEGTWRVTEVDSPAVQRQLIELLGEDGLPDGASARPWRGGLAGRDAVGRRTATVLLLAVEDQTQVDGNPIADPGRDRIITAIRAALDHRRRLAEEAHATYQPQVALALSRREPALRQIQLAKWARTAGAEEILLVVRGAKGGPALLPIARQMPVRLGQQPPPIAQVVEDPAGVHFRVGEVDMNVAMTAEGLDRTGVATAIKRLRKQIPRLAGGVIHLAPASEHGWSVELLDACRSAAPDLGFIVSAPIE